MNGVDVITVPVQYEIRFTFVSLFGGENKRILGSQIRNFGFLANRNRREALPLCRSFLPAVPDQLSTLLTETHQRAVERKCPFCRTGTLHIIERISARELLQRGTVAGENTS
jgi:hypothetical protein